jgi:DNA-binding IclR family transcriptional regulator
VCVVAERLPTPFGLDSRLGVVAEQSPRTGTQAIERALSVLGVLEAGGDSASLSELSRGAGLSPSTTHRLARALCEADFMHQDPVTERYGFGRRLVTLGQRASAALGLDAARTTLQALAAQTGESVNLGVLDGDEVIVLLGVSSNQRLRFDQETGSRVPAYASAMGKALLAHSNDPDGVVAALPRLAKLTGRTITSRPALRAELDAVHDRGWALNDEEREAGVRTVAAPVLDGAGHAVAAIAVQGPSIRMTDDRLATIAAAVQHAARDVAAQVGSL